MKTMQMVLMGLALTACHGIESDLAQLDDVNVAPGTMVGDMPAVEAFDDALTVNDAQIWGTWMDVDLHVEGDYGWAMVAGDVDLWEHVDMTTGLPTIEYGTEMVLDGWDWVGCAGPESYDADFDEAPDAVRITFEDPKSLGLVDGDADISDTAVGVVVDAVFGAGDAVRAVTLARLY